MTKLKEHKRENCYDGAGIQKVTEIDVSLILRFVDQALYYPCCIFFSDLRWINGFHLALFESRGKRDNERG